jgi:hypothetical protein
MSDETLMTGSFQPIDWFEFPLWDTITVRYKDGLVSKGSLILEEHGSEWLDLDCLPFDRGDERPVEYIPPDPALTA